MDDVCDASGDGVDANEALVADEGVGVAVVDGAAQDPSSSAPTRTTRMLRR
jgi:hypothetical protein